MWTLQGLEIFYPDLCLFLSQRKSVQFVNIMHQCGYNSYYKIGTNFWPNDNFVLIHASIIHMLKKLSEKSRGCRVESMKEILHGFTTCSLCRDETFEYYENTAHGREQPHGTGTGNNNDIEEILYFTMESNTVILGKNYPLVMLPEGEVDHAEYKWELEEIQSFTKESDMVILGENYSLEMLTEG